MFHLTDEGWRKLTWRWALFFFALAVLNEIVWRNADDRFLGQLQGVRRGAADVSVRRAAISADQEIRSVGRARSGPAEAAAASALSISGSSALVEILGRDRPDQLVGDAAVAADHEGLRHAIDAPVDRGAAVCVGAGGGERIAVAVEKAPRVVGLRPCS